MKLPVEIKIINPAAAVPVRATEMSAAVDLRVQLDGCEAVTIEPDMQVVLGTGLAINIADASWCAMILPRSGLGVKGVVLGNLVGLIDADYQGELKVCIWNRSAEPVTITNNDRVAQLLFVPVGIPDFKLVESFTPTARGEGGFGSSGTC